jgi:hypothetical protein
MALIQGGRSDGTLAAVQVDASGRLITGGLPAAAVTNAGFAAAYVAGSSPSTGTTGGQTGSFGRVRTNITYAGSVTAATIRLYTRTGGAGTAWFRGASSDDISPLTPASGNESRDWQVGAGVECSFVLESVSPGTAGNTVQVDVAGVSS